VWAAHAYAQFGDILYPPGFKHFSHVNPVAPKGGDIALVAPTRASSFDKYNPFTMKGTAPPGLGFLMFETLLVGNTEEPTTRQSTQRPDGIGIRTRLQGR
jgi:microcin C transport system substrate-binding protein